MPRVYKKKEKIFNKESIKKALDEITNGASIYQTAKKYFISYGYMHKLVQRNKSQQDLFPARSIEKNLYLSKAIEEKLAIALRQMEAMGLGPTLEEFINIVHDYIIENEIKTKFLNDKPGYEWGKAFLKRNNLKLKKGTPINVVRKRVTSDPFVIYDYYNQLEEKIKELGIEGKPDCFWNLDESSFPLDPSKKSIIGSCGKKTLRVTAGCSRENITVLATCCANGKALDPLVVYQGTKLMHSWIGNGESILEGIQYAHSRRGWMTKEVFEEFFESFVKQTEDTRPLLLVMDGHLSHISIKTIELAIKENITLMKLPAHCTDLLQPLDISCFSPLKNYYDKELTQYVQSTGGNVTVKKDIFVELLCKVWRKGLSPHNIKSGFEKSGIFPLDAGMYDVQRLDPVKLKTYHAWVERGRPLTPDNTPDLEGSVEIINVERNVEEIEERSETPPPTETSFNTPHISTPLPSEMRNSLSQSEMLSPETPRSRLLKEITIEEFIKELQRRMGPKMKINITFEPVTERTVEEILHARGRSAGEKITSRRAIQTKALVLSHEKCLQELKDKELNTIKKTARKGVRGRPKSVSVPGSSHAVPGSSHAKKRKISNKVHEETTSESEMSITSGSSDTLYEEFDEKSDVEQEEEEEKEEEEQCEDVTNPHITSDSVNKYFAVLYTDPSTYFWGKVLKVFTHDVDGDVKEVEMKFLRKNNIGSFPSEWNWKDGSETATVNKKFVIYGPELPTIKKGLLYFDDEACLKTFNIVKTKF